MLDEVNLVRHQRARQSKQRGGGLTVVSFGLGELEVSDGHKDRRFEQWHGLWWLGHIHRAEAAPDNRRCRKRPKVRGAGGGSGARGSCSSTRSLCFGCRRAREKMIGRRRGMTGQQRKMRSWRQVVPAGSSVHIEAAGCSTLPLDLSDIFLHSLYDNVQTAAHTARPQSTQLLSSHGNPRQSISSWHCWNVFTSQTICFEHRSKDWVISLCCCGSTIILNLVAVGTRCQTVTGQKQLLPGERGRLIQNGFQRATPGLRSGGNDACTAATYATVTSSHLISSPCRRLRVKFPTEYVSHWWFCLITWPLSEQRQEETLCGAKWWLCWWSNWGKIWILAFPSLELSGRCDVPTKHWKQIQTGGKAERCKQCRQSVSANSPKRGKESV